MLVHSSSLEGSRSGNTLSACGSLGTFRSCTVSPSCASMKGSKHGGICQEVPPSSSIVAMEIPPHFPKRRHLWDINIIIQCYVRSLEGDKYFLKVLASAGCCIFFRKHIHIIEVFL